MNLSRAYVETMKRSYMKEGTEVAGAKEEALGMVSEFVKNVKKKFMDKKEQIKVLKDAAKLINFYVDEIEGGEGGEESLGDMDSSSDFAPLELDFGDGDGDDDDLESKLKEFKNGHRETR